MADPAATPPGYAPRPDTSLLYVTCASVDEARTVARTLVGERLAACANIIEGMRSIYWWQGELAEGDETVLLLKTTAERVEQAIARVREVHGYAVPCIVELPVARGNPAFLDWIAGEASGRATA